jgi:hypothetical protein
MTIGFAMFEPAVAVSSSEQVQTGLVQSTDDALYRDLLAAPQVVDARNLLDPAAMRRLGFTYVGVGRP